MIRYYYKNLRAKKLTELDAYKPGSWVHVQAPSTDEVDFLTNRFKLDAGHIEDALDPDEMPRLEKEGEQTYIFIRYAYTNTRGELSTAPLLFVVAPDLLITISNGEVPHLNKFLDSQVNFTTTQRTRLVLLILDQIAQRYETLINGLGRQINAIRGRLKGHTINNQDFVDFVVIEDELNEFLSAMEPTTVTLRRLLMGRHIQLFEQDQELVEDLLLDNEQSIEACHSHVKSITNIRESVFDHRQQQPEPHNETFNRGDDFDYHTKRGVRYVRHERELAFPRRAVGLCRGAGAQRYFVWRCIHYWPAQTHLLAPAVVHRLYTIR